MEICPEDPHPREKAPSIIEIRNKIRQGHNECCNCWCCKAPEFKSYKYIQPEKPKPYRPIREYCPADMPMEKETTYKLSYWENPKCTRKPIKPEGCLTTCDGKFADKTTHKLSYLGNYCVKPTDKILPCKRDLFGHGPMEDCTTQKHDFRWKCQTKPKPFKFRGNLCIPKGCLDDDTTYKLSYYGANCLDPVKNYAPIRCYERANVPVDGCTTYRLSFFPTEPIEKENYPWKQKPKYEEPVTPVDTCTTYKLSYWPQCQEVRKPIVQKSDDNILNATPCFDDKTTYCLSYFGGDGDKPRPILPCANEIFDHCPLDFDTTNKLSYMGNWCPQPSKAIKPCTRQLLGRGPVQGCTTQKCDYTWKCNEKNPAFVPGSNFEFSKAPLESCTTNRLSFMPNCQECVIQSKSYAPIRKYEPTCLPMDLDTTMQLSYQPVPEPKKIDKPWAKKIPYEKPVTSLDDNTTYRLSYIPPGKLVPCCSETCSPCLPCCPPPICCSSSKSCPQVCMPRPCISC